MRSFMDFDLTQLGLTYRSWYAGQYPPRQSGYYWAYAPDHFKHWQVVHVRCPNPSKRDLAVLLPGSDDPLSLDEIKKWGPEVLNFSRGGLPWKGEDDD